MDTFHETVSYSLIGIIALPIILFIVKRDIKFLYIVLFSISTNMIHHIIKNYSLNYNYEFTKRPQGATNCNLWANNGNVEGRPGFPSGHVTSTTAFFTSIYLLFPEYQSLAISVGPIYTIFMAYSRMYKKCHTLLQTIAGGFLGYAFPTFIVWILKMCEKK
jgi:membrane-associated phospholipid phosphatase